MMGSERNAEGSIVALGRLQARGQVTVPAAVREALGMQPGDTLMFVVTGERECQVRVLRGIDDLDEFWDRHRIDGPVPEDLWSQALDDMGGEVLREVEESLAQGLSEIAATSDLSD